jgi:redox-sensitive bicupin YhaK (pirin superfamily)
MDTSPKSLVHTIGSQRRAMSDGLTINQIHPDAHSTLLMDPFLAIDSFHMAQPFFRPHPHAGFNAVTYMLPDSPGGFVNRDSLGHRDLIGPGTLHWTAAGSGMMHEEVPWERGLTATGLQIFVNLAAVDKMRRPEALHLDSGDVPVVLHDGSSTLVVAGAHDGTRSPLRPPTDVTILHVTLEPGATWNHSAQSGHTRFLVALGGTVTVEPEGTEIEPDGSGFWSTEGETIAVSNHSNAASRFVVAGGSPLDEPVVFHGPFCMNTTAQIDDAVRRYHSGAMGHLDASF